MRDGGDARRPETSAALVLRVPDLQHPAAHVQVALRERDFDVVLAELVVDGEIEGAHKAALAVYRARGPGAQLELERAVAELEEAHRGRRIVEHVLFRMRHFQQQLLHLAHVAAVSHADRDAKAHRGVVVLPVDDILGNELRVRHDDGDVVVGQHLGAARADLDDVALDLVDFDAVADLDRPLEHDDQAAEEIAHHVLQAEAHADADRARQHVEGGEVDAGGLHDDQQPEEQQHVARDGGHGVARPHVELGARQPCVHPAAQPRSDEEQRDQQQHDVGQRAQRERLVAELEQRDGEDAFQFVEPGLHQGRGMNSPSSRSGSFMRPARQSAFACSMRAFDEDTKFHSM
jgi:hypothetical protein